MVEPILVSGFQQGDEAAFEAIYTSLVKRLRYFAAGFVAENVAHDHVQDAFIKLWERRAQFSSYNAIKTFLYLTVKNACLNTIKHDVVVSRHEQMPHSSADEKNTLQRIIEAEVIDEIALALQKLPEGCRNVVFLSYFEGLSNQEVADRLHISINTVKTQKLRALKTLRGIFTDLSPLVLLMISRLD